MLIGLMLIGLPIVDFRFSWPLAARGRLIGVAPLVARVGGRETRLGRGGLPARGVIAGHRVPAPVRRSRRRGGSARRLGPAGVILAELGEWVGLADQAGKFGERIAAARPRACI